MAEYQRQIAGANTGFQSVTPKQRPGGADTVATEILFKLSGGMIQGFASEKLAQGVRQATGASVSEEQVAANVKGFEEYMRPLVESEEITPETYNQMATEYLSSINADAKTVDRLVKSRQLSALHGEALVRRRVSAAMANPFWAALGGRISAAAGPLGGGKDVALSAFATAEQRDLYEQAEVEREAVSNYRKLVAEIQLKTGASEEAIQENIRVRTEWEEKQKTAAATAPEAISRQMTGDYLAFTDEMVKRINPETQTIDAVGLQELEALASTMKADLTAAIMASPLPDADKKAKIEALEMQHKGMLAMAQARSVTKIAEGINEQLMSELKLKGNQADPITAYFAAQGNQSMMKILAYMDTKQKKFEYERMFPQLKDPVEFSSGMTQAARLFSEEPGRFSPSPVVAMAASAPTAAELNKTAYETKEDMDKKWSIQGSRYPEGTMKGLREGPMTISANKGDESSQRAISAVVNSFVAQIQADLSLDPSAPPITLLRAPKKGPYAQAQVLGQTITGQLVLPDHMGDRKTQLEELYKIVEANPWMWPKGSSDVVDAFERIANGYVRVGPESVMKEEGAETETMEINPLTFYRGVDAVRVVEQLEGTLSPAERQVVMDEGYRKTEYLDTKGNPTRGVGQTGDYANIPFKEAFAAKKREIDRKIPEIGTYPEEVQIALYSAGYRGDLEASPKTIQLINEGRFTEAAKEFLNNEEYKKAPKGIKERMNRTAEAIRKLAEVNEVKE